MKLEHTI